MGSQDKPVKSDNWFMFISIDNLLSFDCMILKCYTNQMNLQECFYFEMGSRIVHGNIIGTFRIHLN